MGESKADLLLTDPPYNVALGMGGSVDEARKRHRRTDGLVIMNDKMPDEKFREFLASVFKNADAVMSEGASFYIWHANNESYNFNGACRDIGWTVRQTLIWNKNAITLGRQDYQWRHEPCLYGWTKGTHRWFSDRKQATVIDMPRPTKSEEHPTMKPVALFAYQIQNSTQTGDIVLDTFGGSGTSIIACEQLKRKCYTMELDPRYIDVIIARWEKFTGKKAQKI
jgi:site-specific DNA-methyltransferase (adenine-specific)